MNMQHNITQHLGTIKLRINRTHGFPIYIPACEASEAFCYIAGTGSLTKPVIGWIKKLGYNIDVVPETLPVL